MPGRLVHFLVALHTLFSLITGNPYYFTGREMDTLDNGSLKIMNYRHRYYDTYTGRFTTHDPLCILPNVQKFNCSIPQGQYSQGSNLYEYVSSVPLTTTDPFGLKLLKPYTCPGRISDPEAEERTFRVWWRDVWKPFGWSPRDPITGGPIFGWPANEYREVNYEVRGWIGVQIKIAAGGKCSELITLRWRSWVLPNYHEVVEKHLDCERSWHSYGRPCKAFFKCKQQCCDGASKWTVEWNSEVIGVLNYDTTGFGSLSGAPHCEIGDRDPKKICWEYRFKCAACNRPK